MGLGRNKWHFPGFVVTQLSASRAPSGPHTTPLAPHIRSELAKFVDQDSSVGIATCYGLDCLGIDSHCVEIFCTCPDLPWGPPSLLYIGY